MPYLLSRARITSRAFNKLALRGTHHSATGRFITKCHDGTPVVQETKIWLGGPQNTYVMFGPEISQAFQAAAATASQVDYSTTQDGELLQLNFYHDSRHFAHKSSPYPRLEIPQDLPRQSIDSTSPASLYAYGATHSIALDGTTDAAIESCARESFQRLQPVLDKLKDM